MDHKALIDMLTEGLPAEQEAVVRAAIERDATKAKVLGIKAQNEYQALVDEQNRLKADLEGAEGKPGSKAYRDWYNENYAKVKANADAIAAYDAKHGAGAFDRASKGEGAPPAQNPNGNFLTREAAQALLQEEFSKNQAPNIAAVLKNTGKIVQRHMFAGRKTEIDFDKLDNIMGEEAKKGRAISIEQAYDMWDAPEREKSAKAAEDARVDQRVKDELAKRGAGATFPGAADFTPTSLGERTKAEVDKFDPVQLKQDLARNWMTADTTAA